MFPRLLAAALTCALTSPLLLASPASADCGRAAQPTCSILRPTADVRSRAVPFAAPECIVTVGGLGSTTAYDDGFFDPVLDPLLVDPVGPRYEVHRFGVDRRADHPYDTYGAIAVSAIALRDLVRDLSEQCSAIDVIAHSMGGAVADRAFSFGLSTAGGVAAYLPMSSPHNGALAARALRLGVELDRGYASLVHDLSDLLGWHDPNSAAVRDLARITPPRLARVDVAVRQRMADDLVVLRQDNIDRRSDVREYLPPLALLAPGADLVPDPADLDGHSRIVRDPFAQEVVRRAIRDHVVPPEQRSAVEVKAAKLVSRLADGEVSGIYSYAGLVTGGAAAISAAISGDDELSEHVDDGLPVVAELGWNVVLAAIPQRIGLIHDLIATLRE